MKFPQHSSSVQLRKYFRRLRADTVQLRKDLTGRCTVTKPATQHRFPGCSHSLEPFPLPLSSCSRLHRHAYPKGYERRLNRGFEP